MNGSPAPDVLILGGSGRIGTAVALDILEHTGARVCLASRRPRLPPSLGALEPGRVRLARLDLTEAGALAALLSPPAGRLAPSVTSPVTPPVSPPVSLSGKAAYDLVIHCAGPFRQRDLGVLEACIAARVNYLDVSDSPDYVRSALALGEAAQRAGVTAIVSTGVFPGWSNSMARLAAEQFASLDRLQLNYVVAGSGGRWPHGDAHHIFGIAAAFSSLDRRGLAAGVALWRSRTRQLSSPPMAQPRSMDSAPVKRRRCPTVLHATK